MIRVTCKNCSKTLSVKDSSAGKRGKCPECGSAIQVPELATDQTEEELPDPLIAMASNAASSVASAAGSAASAVGSAVTGFFKKSDDKQVIVVPPASQDVPDWMKVFTRDNQNPEVVRAVADKVSGILMVDEELRYIAVQNRPVINFAPDCIALTNKRFIFYRPKLLGRVDFEDYVWRDLHDAKLSENIIGSTIRVTASNGKTLSMDYLPKVQARSVYRIAQEMEEIALQQRRDRSLEEKRAGAGGVVVQANIGQPAATVQDDPVAKLQKLKTMLDAGLITQSEYDAKKADILASM